MRGGIASGGEKGLMPWQWWIEVLFPRGYLKTTRNINLIAPKIARTYRLTRPFRRTGISSPSKPYIARERTRVAVHQNTTSTTTLPVTATKRVKWEKGTVRNRNVINRANNRKLQKAVARVMNLLFRGVLGASGFMSLLPQV